jgi:hypothetical protein
MSVLQPSCSKRKGVDFALPQTVSRDHASDMPVGRRKLNVRQERKEVKGRSVFRRAAHAQQTSLPTNPTQRLLEIAGEMD